MARTIYPGLTKTESRRHAKHSYRVTKDAPEGVCIVRFCDWIVTKKGPKDSVLESHYVYHIKDAHTGALIDVDTRTGEVERRAPHQMSWFH